MKNYKETIRKLIRGINLLESIFLVTILMSMILLAVVQIIIRNGFDTGLVWSDAAVRIMVLWVTFLGAMVASRKGQHISIDLINHYLSKKIQRFFHAVVNLVTAFISLLTAYIGYRFVAMEYQDGMIAFASIPAWSCELIIPIGFTVIALRYFIHIFVPADAEVKQ